MYHSIVDTIITSRCTSPAAADSGCGPFGPESPLLFPFASPRPSRPPPPTPSTLPFNFPFLLLLDYRLSLFFPFHSLSLLTRRPDRDPAGDPSCRSRGVVLDCIAHLRACT